MANAPVVLAAEWLGDYWAVLGGHGKILVFLAIAARYLLLGEAAGGSARYLPWNTPNI